MSVHAVGTSGSPARGLRPPRRLAPVMIAAVAAASAALVAGVVAAAMAPSAANSWPQPWPTHEYQTPTGRNELAWSKAILSAMGAPLTRANIISMGYWMQNEAGSPPRGIVGANNPINVSEPGYGGRRIRHEGGGYFLYSYPSVWQGVAATAAYLHRPNYREIFRDLKNGSGLNHWSLRREFLVYSGHSYSKVPDGWGRSQGMPRT